jgi:hypothetical protein
VNDGLVKENQQTNPINSAPWFTSWTCAVEFVLYHSYTFSVNVCAHFLISSQSRVSNTPGSDS